MRGAPLPVVQALVGHQDLTMTQRYSHLTPAALTNAVRLLDPPEATHRDGDIVETVVDVEQKASA